MKSNSRRQGKREPKVREERKVCEFGQRLLGIAEHKVKVVDIGAPAFIGEDKFFRCFVFPVLGAHHGDKKAAAKKVPGLEYRPCGKGVNWRLSFEKFAVESSAVMFGALLANCHEESPLYIHGIRRDERNHLSRAG